jgi:hypothetical protein
MTALTRRGVKARKAPPAVVFAPPLSSNEWELNSYEFVTDSIGIWLDRLTKIPCPSCGVVGSLDVEMVPFGVRVFCVRFKNCEHETEIISR